MSADGVPNVSPKEIFVPRGDRELLIANIASPQSARNIRERPAVCVSFVDVFVQKGFKLAGTAEVIGTGDGAFESLAGPLRAKAGPDFPFKTLFRVSVGSVLEIVAPRYRLFPETPESDQVAAARAAYGVTAART